MSIILRFWWGTIVNRVVLVLPARAPLFVAGACDTIQDKGLQNGLDNFCFIFPHSNTRKKNGKNTFPPLFSVLRPSSIFVTVAFLLPRRRHWCLVWVKDFSDKSEHVHVTLPPLSFASNLLFLTNSIFIRSSHARTFYSWTLGRFKSFFFFILNVFVNPPGIRSQSKSSRQL